MRTPFLLALGCVIASLGCGAPAPATSDGGDAASDVTADAAADAASDVPADTLVTDASLDATADATPTDVAADVPTTDASPVTCGTQTCTASQECVAHASGIPNGTTSYACIELPAGCGALVDQRCPVGTGCPGCANQLCGSTPSTQISMMGRRVDCLGQ